MKNCKDFLAVSVILFIIAIIFTWPLCINLTKAIPLGGESCAVSLVHLTLIEWSGMAFDGMGSYWNAPFFYPYQGSYAWWEPQPFTCILIWLLSKLTGYIAAFNIIIFLYIVCFGLIGYAQARLLTEDSLTAIWPAIWLTAGSYVLQQISSPALIAAAFPFSCLYFIFVFFKSSKRVFLWTAALMYALTWFTCKQFAAFLTILLPVILIPFVSLRKIKSLGVISFFLALLAVCAIVLPYSLKQLAYTAPMGFEFAYDRSSSVLRWADLFMPAKGHWLVTHILGWAHLKGYYSRDVGVTALLLIIASLVFGIFKSFARDDFKKKLMISLGGMVVTALLLGFGPKADITIAGRQYGLYSSIYSFIPGSEFVRTPGRFGLFVMFATAVLASASFAYIRSRIKDRNINLALTFSMFFLLLAEMYAVPIALVYPDKEIRAHQGGIQWLYKNGRGRPVLELPLASGTRSEDLYLEAGAVYRMLRHGNPVVNGYMSFPPSPYKQLRIALLSDTLRQGRRYIEAYGARYLFLHKDMLSKTKRNNIQQALGENIAYEDENDVIYEMPEKVSAQDIKQILPVKAKLVRIPQEGKIYVLPLDCPVEQALLIMPQPDWIIEVSWPDESGMLKRKKIRIVGSIILDINQKNLYFKILDFSNTKNEAKARLISPEEAYDMLK